MESLSSIPSTQKLQHTSTSPYFFPVESPTFSTPPSTGLCRHGRRGAVPLGLRRRRGGGAGAAQQPPGGAAAGAEPWHPERLGWGVLMDLQGFESLNMGTLSLWGLTMQEWGVDRI